MSWKNVSTLAAAGIAAAALTTLAAGPAIGARPAPAADGPIAASPYLYFGAGNAPKPSEVSGATGIKDYTLAFVLAQNGCNPAWDGQRPLDGPDSATIDQIRAAGGDAIPSIGGYNGNKLGEACQDASSLAGAYQKVIDAYQLKAIDVDIEATEFQTPQAQDRVLEALKKVKAGNPGLRTVVTFPATTAGPSEDGKRMISRAAETRADIDVWTQMPFDFGGQDMVRDTVNATDGLKDQLKQAFGYDDAAAYAHAGISSMNGKTDNAETVTVDQFRQISDYAKKNALGRLTFWSVNRDRACEGGGGTDSCSGIDQQPWDFTKVVAGFHG